jgi:hypothetical protein
MDQSPKNRPLEVVDDAGSRWSLVRPQGGRLETADVPNLAYTYAAAAIDERFKTSMPLHASFRLTVEVLETTTATTGKNRRFHTTSARVQGKAIERGTSCEVHRCEGPEVRSYSSYFRAPSVRPPYEWQGVGVRAPEVAPLQRPLGSLDVCSY